jgi:hypothetical protein
MEVLVLHMCTGRVLAKLASIASAPLATNKTVRFFSGLSSSRSLDSVGAHSSHAARHLAPLSLVLGDGFEANLLYELAEHGT